MVIEHLSDRALFSFERKIFGVSTITIFELLRLPGISEQEESAIRAFCSLCVVVAVDETISATAAIMSRTRLKKHALDLLIAATAVTLHVPLITKNVKDFRRISDLVVYDSLNDIA